MYAVSDKKFGIMKSRYQVIFVVFRVNCPRIIRGKGTSFIKSQTCWLVYSWGSLLSLCQPPCLIAMCPATHSMFWSLETLRLHNLLCYRGKDLPLLSETIKVKYVTRYAWDVLESFFQWFFWDSQAYTLNHCKKIFWPQFPELGYSKIITLWEFSTMPVVLKNVLKYYSVYTKHIIQIYWLANTELICTTYFVSKQISCSRFCKTLEEVALGLYLTSCLFPLFINVVWDWFNLLNW